MKKTELSIPHLISNSANRPPDRDTVVPLRRFFLPTSARAARLCRASMTRSATGTNFKGAHASTKSGGKSSQEVPAATASTERRKEEEVERNLMGEPMVFLRVGACIVGTDAKPCALLCELSVVMTEPAQLPWDDLPKRCFSYQDRLHDRAGFLEIIHHAVVIRLLQASAQIEHL